jgi:hypothetical protein
LSELLRHGDHDNIAVKILGSFQEWDQGATPLNVIHVLERHAPAIPKVFLPDFVASRRPLGRTIFICDKEAVNAEFALGMVSAVIGTEH